VQFSSRHVPSSLYNENIFIWVLSKQIPSLAKCIYGTLFFSLSFTFSAIDMSAYSTYTDEELVYQVQKSNKIAFTEVYNRYWEQLLALGYYYTRSKHSAEDIVHDVFTSLWVRRAELPIQSLKAYLATSVKFAVFKSIARDKHRRHLQQGLTLPTHSNEVEAKLDTRFLQDYLNGVVEQLPDKARIVFTFSRAQELSIKEIATKLDLSPKAVEYHMTKALRALKEAVQKIKCFFV